MALNYFNGNSKQSSEQSASVALKIAMGKVSKLDAPKGDRFIISKSDSEIKESRYQENDFVLRDKNFKGDLAAITVAGGHIKESNYDLSLHKSLITSNGESIIDLHSSITDLYNSKLNKLESSVAVAVAGKLVAVNNDGGLVVSELTPMPIITNPVANSLAIVNADGTLHSEPKAPQILKSEVFFYWDYFR